MSMPRRSWAWSAASSDAHPELETELFETPESWSRRVEAAKEAARLRYLDKVAAVRLGKEALEIVQAAALR